MRIVIFEPSSQAGLASFNQATVPYDAEVITIERTFNS